MASALVSGNFGLYAARYTVVKTPCSNGPGTPFNLYSLQFQLSANNGTPMASTRRLRALPAHGIVEETSAHGHINFRNR
ncbi:hypothetical protein EWM64_g7966 [Hericium alpestre]|uniref:Uncharacterized protein n=1 Tax=Hericium alpestre TaxID=135208 RepID=A0A4Y9ZMF0_9AGAM|nr:hypothetical protein EWM64_g7966 [Hericium alpestre]